MNVTAYNRNTPTSAFIEVKVVHKIICNVVLKLVLFLLIASALKFVMLYIQGV